MRPMSTALLLGLVACTGGAAVDVDGTELQVRSWIEGQPSRGVATLAVQITHEPGAAVDVDEPSVQGLRFTEVGRGEQERLGDSLVVTRRYRFAGDAGSYQIPALTVRELPSADDTDTPDQASSDAIWVDVGAEAPEIEGFADIEDPPKVFQLSNVAIAGGICAGLGGLGLLGSLGLALFAFSGRKPATLPPEAPDVVALRRWNAVRSDPNLDDNDKAIALATIFREYIEVVLQFPATAWTTAEILAHLQNMAHLPDGNVGRAKRVLRATDRIKYADASARETLFEELDDALRTFIASTKPRGWDGDPQ